MAGGGTPQVAAWGVWRSSYPQVDLPAGGIMNPQMDRSSSRGDGIAQRERHRLGRTIYDCCWWSCNLTSLKGLCWCLIAYPWWLGRRIACISLYLLACISPSWILAYISLDCQIVTLAVATICQGYSGVVLPALLSYGKLCIHNGDQPYGANAWHMPGSMPGSHAIS